MDCAKICLISTVMPIVSRFGSYVDIGLAICISQYRKSNIGISAKSHIDASLNNKYKNYKKSCYRANREYQGACTPLLEWLWERLTKLVLASS